MAILKMRDADGNIKSIAIMKGDKGDGVPDGGSAGQVVKKTDEGTEWADFAATPAVVMSNTDTTVTTAAITKRGLYEVDVAFSLYKKGDILHPYEKFLHHKFIVSVDDLSKAQAYESFVYAMPSTFSGDEAICQYVLTLTYSNNTLSSKIRYKIPYSSWGVEASVSDTDYPTCIAEVKLLIPYA